MCSENITSSQDCTSISSQEIQKDARVKGRYSYGAGCVIMLAFLAFFVPASERGCIVAASAKCRAFFIRLCPLVPGISFARITCAVSSIVLKMNHSLASQSLSNKNQHCL